MEAFKSSASGALMFHVLQLIHNEKKSFKENTKYIFFAFYSK